MPVYLGVDYGTKRIGLAWADELGISLPLESIPGVELEGCWEEFTRVLREREVTEIVVGYPCLLYTSPSPRDGLLSRMPSSA